MPGCHQHEETTSSSVVPTSVWQPSGCGCQAKSTLEPHVEVTPREVEKGPCECQECKSFYKDCTEEDVYDALPWLSIDIHDMERDIWVDGSFDGVHPHESFLLLDEQVLDNLDNITSWREELNEKVVAQNDQRSRVQKPRPDGNPASDHTGVRYDEESNVELASDVYRDFVCLEYQEWIPSSEVYKFHSFLSNLDQNLNNQPGCWPIKAYDQTERKFIVTWNGALKGKNASEFIRSMRGGEEILFDSIINSGFLDKNNIHMNEFSSIINGQKWLEWDNGYIPMFSDFPRFELMRMALWLLASMEEGVIESFDRFGNVRENVLGEILNKNMSYKLYDPKKKINKIWQSNCHGMEKQSFVSTPKLQIGSQICGDKYNNVLVSKKLIMYGNLIFEFKNINEYGKDGVLSGNNHGFPASNRTVHFCTLNIDRQAVIYDWAMTLAASHMLASFSSNHDEERMNHEKAQNICIRMAFTALVDIVETILHETSHNLDLWHCAESENKKASCVQDVVAATWMYYTIARLGLSRVRSDWEANFKTTLYWDRYLGDTSDYEEEGRFIDFNIECKQGSMLSPGLEKLLYVLTVLFGVPIPIAMLIVLAAAALGPAAQAILAAMMLASYGFAIASSEIREALTTDISPATNARIHWGIDYTLIMGGHLRVCVVTSRIEECNPTPFTNCFQMNAPEGLLDCEFEVTGGKQNEF